MSKFYDEIAEYYDDIFPVQDIKTNLIIENLKKNPSNILDIACGTGGYAMQLYNQGHNLTAIDLDSEMIDKLQNKNPNINSKVMDMLKLNTLDEKFDLIYSLGNSIVHLDSIKLIENFFESCYSSLNNEGVLIIQIINYDRILDNKITSLDTIKNDEKKLSFIRNYNYNKDENKIAFHTILKVKEKVFENTVKLLPIRSKEIEKSLENSGFKDIMVYGDFSKNDFDSNKSVACVVVANKK
jgi:SAM-dependent methyltransferase